MVIIDERDEIWGFDVVMDRRMEGYSHGDREIDGLIYLALFIMESSCM